MELQMHDISSLFAQLGLPSEPEAIEDFIKSHGPLPEKLRLHEAPFWTPAQATFLCDEILEDADWAEVVDNLNVRLRPRAWMRS